MVTNSERWPSRVWLIVFPLSSSAFLSLRIIGNHKSGFCFNYILHEAITSMLLHLHVYYRQSLMTLSYTVAAATAPAKESQVYCLRCGNIVVSVSPFSVSYLTIHLSHVVIVTQISFTTGRRLENDIISALQNIKEKIWHYFAIYELRSKNFTIKITSSSGVTLVFIFKNCSGAGVLCL